MIASIKKAKNDREELMLLQNKATSTLVEVMDIQSLINPMENEIFIRMQSGEEEQDPEINQKENLIFPSGEELPRCWLDSNFRDP
jgi:hypothetical protein